ncbi:MAG: ABC transporter substrate-binding protein/permease [Lachnospiraceae bacterium]|nr:ABC transporter substrate-binding protein/permease [Lachnospiraceae bacterium]
MYKRKKSWQQLLFPLFLCIGILCFVTGCHRDTSVATDKLPLKVSSVDDLKGKKIGVQLGTTGDLYASDYENDDYGTKVERYNKGNDAIQALKNDKIDAVIIDEEPAKAFVNANSNLLILTEDFANEEYAICIGKENTQLLDNINQALEQLKENGTLDKIKKNYTGSDSEKGCFPYIPMNIDRPNGTLTVATNATFPPYEYHQNGKITGFDIDMMQAICDILGMELQIVDMEFDSIINAVQSGKADVGASGFTITEERKQNINFSIPYTNAKQVIIVKNPNATEDSLSFSEKFKQNFLEDERWKYLTEGLKSTLIITFFSLIIGIILGFLVAIIRTWHEKNGGLSILNLLCKLYLTVVRGTPVVIQLLIIYYVIFSSVNIDKVLVAVIAFGLNSAAYVAEIVRSGIMSIEQGQFEAGRSLGLTFSQTMRHIILPQAVKNILPALGNEFIVLLKETSISGYIGLADLTKGGDIIRSVTYEPFLPLVAVALIYLVLVTILTSGVHALERRLASNEKSHQ